VRAIVFLLFLLNCGERGIEKSKIDDRRKKKRWVYYTGKTCDAIANPAKMIIFKFHKKDILRQHGQRNVFYCYSAYRSFLKSFKFEKWIDYEDKEG